MMSIKDVLKLEQYGPKDWNAAVDYDGWTQSEPTSQWLIHWPGMEIRTTADSGNVGGEKAALRDIEGSVMRDGKYAGIPYDWAVGNSGSLYRLRGLGRSAATSGDADADGVSNNHEGEALLFLVSPKGTISDAAFATAQQLIEASGFTEVYAHKDAKGIASACPGPQATAWARAYPWATQESDAAPAKPVASKPAPKPVQGREKTTTNWTEKIMADLGSHKKGDRGIKVKRLQSLLNCSGLQSLKEDGLYGALTERAVTEYQEHFRLTVDGVVGPQTWKHLLLSNY